MASKLKEGLYYFPIDIDMFEDHKILLAQELIDPSGNNPTERLLVPYMAIRILREIYKNGYYIQWNNLRSLTLSSTIPGITMGILNNYTNCLIESGFFNKDMFTKFSILTSKGIQERWYRVVKNFNRKSVVIIQEYKLYTFEKQKSLDFLPKSPEEMAKSPEEMVDNGVHFPTIRPSSSLLYTSISSNKDSTNGITNNTNNNDDEDEKMKSPEEMAKSPEEMAKSPEEMAKSPEEMAKSPEEMAKSPEEMAKSPEEMAKSPEEMAKSPEEMAKSPEFISEIGFYTVEHLLEIYFTANSMIRTREQVAMISHMDISTLRDWAEAFNRFLISEGTSQKQKTDWPKHFKRWLNLQDKNQNPQKLFNEKSEQNGKPKQHQNGSSNGEKILNENFKRNLYSKFTGNKG